MPARKFAMLKDIMMYARIGLMALAVFLIVQGIPQYGHAQSADLTVTPVVIDEKVKVRDILKKSVTVTNSSNRKLNLYPSVNDINPQEGEEEFVASQNAAERSGSLANWIELSRGVVELGPGESKELPFVIRTHLDAAPGTYHATISLGEGSSRSQAEEAPPLAEVAVNVEVMADIKEVMQLNKFFTDNVFFSGDDVLFNYQLENIGNQELQPRGEIRIYNRRGEEVAAVDVNTEGKKFSPEQTAQLASVWNAATGFGRFKAFLNVDYGNSQTGSVQDTVYFWVIPWKQLLALFTASAIAVIALALYFHRWFEERHLAKLAIAGHLSEKGVQEHQLIEATPATPDPTPHKEPVHKEIPLAVPTEKVSRFGLPAFLRRSRTVVQAPLAVQTTETKPRGLRAALEGSEVVDSTPVRTPSPVVPASTPIPEPVRVAAPAQKPTSGHGQTIDLKRIRSSSSPAAPTTNTGHGHVINLKR